MVEALQTTNGLALPVRRVDVERPWQWLTAGWRDLCAAPVVSLAYGAVFVVVSFTLTLGLWLYDLAYLVLPLAAGFLLVAPMLAVGLYESSRRLERGKQPRLGDAVRAWRRNAGGLAAMGLVLALFMLAWIRIAFLVFALFFGTADPNFAMLVDSIFFSLVGIPFLVVGTIIGGVLAAGVFALSVVAPPLLLDRDVGALTAMATSVAAVLRNWRVMIGWGALIVLFTAGGLVTAYIGLALTWPLIGHASWHAYRDLVA